MGTPDLPPLDSNILPTGVRSRFAEGTNGLRMHLLEAGHGEPGRPCLLLLHGFPELAYSWRKVMPALAAAGYHVIAPDLRGYGRTATGPVAYEADLAPFRMHNLLLDLLCLLAALGRERVAAVIGHDFGSWVAGYAALARPDVFEAVVLMSAPFGGAPTFEALRVSSRPPAEDPIHADLAALPRPREHYHRYFASSAAAADMDGGSERVGAFLRAYFHHKSADWSGNRPHPLLGWTAEALAVMPTYYVMDHGRSMPATVAPGHHPRIRRRRRGHRMRPIDAIMDGDGLSRPHAHGPPRPPDRVPCAQRFHGGSDPAIRPARRRAGRERRAGSRPRS